MHFLLTPFFRKNPFRGEAVTISNQIIIHVTGITQNNVIKRLLEQHKI